jgi:hypothetical protein
MVNNGAALSPMAPVDIGAQLYLVQCLSGACRGACLGVLGWDRVGSMS